MSHLDERYHHADLVNAEARDRRDEPDPTPWERTARHDEIVRLVRAGRITEARALAGARRAA